MLSYWTDVLLNKGLDEQRCQHQICLENEFGKSDYTVIDLEYEVSSESEFRYQGERKTKTGERPTPRFDIVAVRNINHQLCVIELKKGVNALSGTSGIQEHAESFANTIGHDAGCQTAFINEMKGIIDLKKTMGLIPDDLFIDEKYPVEFLFAYQFIATDQTHATFDQQKQLFAHYQNETNIHGVNYAKNKRVIWLDDKCFSLMDDK